VGAVADDATLRGWVVDPSSGREGAGELVIRDGRLDGGVRWLAGSDADGLGADGVLIAPGFLDLHAHLREPGNDSVRGPRQLNAHAADAMMASLIAR